MSRGLMVKTLHETWVVTLLFGLGIGFIEGAFAYILPTFFDEISAQWLQTKFVRDILGALLGTEVGDSLGSGAMASIAWAHPLVLTLIWGHAIVFCTRVPAGEVDRGTIDVLFGLPVSRMRIYLSESLVWMVSGMVIVAMGLLGNTVGGRSTPAEFRFSLVSLLSVVANLYCLYLAVGGMAFMVSSLSDRRGRAIAIVFALVLASFALTFLAQVWAPAQAVSFLSVLSYYRPMLILRDHSWPISDILVLLAAGATLWTAGAIVFTRRNLCTV